MKAVVTLTHEVTLIVEGDDLDQITDWARQRTPSEADDDACKNGGSPVSNYYEEIEEAIDDAPVDIKINQ